MFKWFSGWKTNFPGYFGLKINVLLFQMVRQRVYTVGEGPNRVTTQDTAAVRLNISSNTVVLSLGIAALGASALYCVLKRQ